MSAVSRINWGKLAGAVASRQQTQASLSAFRKQYDDLKRQLSVLEDQKTTVDFNYYRKTLNNTKIVDQLESTFKKYKPVVYSADSQKDIISAYEAKAIEKAEQTAKSIENEVSSLKDTLKNIESARPVDELSVDDVCKALPEIDQKLEGMLKKGQWTVPGLHEKIPPIPFF